MSQPFDDGDIVEMMESFLIDVADFGIISNVAKRAHESETFREGEPSASRLSNQKYSERTRELVELIDDIELMCAERQFDSTPFSRFLAAAFTQSGSKDAEARYLGRIAAKASIDAFAAARIILAQSTAHLRGNGDGNILEPDSTLDAKKSARPKARALSRASGRLPPHAKTDLHSAQHFRQFNIAPSRLRAARRDNRIFGQLVYGRWHYSLSDVRRTWPEEFPNQK